ncbi:MAG: hypothetical protein KI790_14280 [Cyclobacteriaceae bacterium]|nr:hypothetical protein [Cyclobacteriaceae bacterium HetDA_MAG_MS6]
MKIATLGLFALIGLITSCSAPQKNTMQEAEAPQTPAVEIPSEAIVFSRIEDEVTVLVNSEEVYNLKKILRTTDPQVILDLDPYLKPGTNEVRIKLWDNADGKCRTNHWGIVYELYNQGEAVDFWSESDDPTSVCEDGFKVDNTHEVEI